MPDREYTERLQARSREAARRAKTDRRVSNARLAVFGTGLVMAWFAFGTDAIRGAWLWLPSVAFLVLMVVHDHVIRTRRRADRAVAYYEAGIARLTDPQCGNGPTGERFADPLHDYAADLDLFGPGGLYPLLCRARTRAGEDRLARWLCEPAGPAILRQRQAAVAELRSALDLRERLALAGEEAAPGLHPERLAAWGADAPTAPGTAVRLAAALIPAATTTSLTGWILGSVGLGPLLACVFVQSAFALALRRRVTRCVSEVEQPVRDLDLLSEILLVLECERFNAPRLKELLALLATEERPASREISRLHRFRDLLDARRNQFFAPIGALLLFTTQIALAVDRWRARNGPKLVEWLEAAGEFEALSSLATHAFERPEDPFPEILESGTRFEARGLGHPLLRDERCVRNDVEIGGVTRLWIVSGSNMSGKSTLLRSIGINAALALAGGTVRAQSLRLAPVAVCSSLRIQDSLQEGHSHFYAEIRRLKSVVERSGSSPPVLFLLDEILHGTNSHDRRIGAEAVVESLIARGAFGLVTTHDLALAKIAERMGEAARNVHFEDTIRDGKVIFDYRVRPGVVTKSNALDLMRSIGLEIGPASPNDAKTPEETAREP